MKQDFSDDEELFFASLDWEREWRKSLPKLNDRELLEVFPIDKETLQEKINEQQERCDCLKAQIQEQLASIPEKDHDIYEVFIEKLSIPKLITAENHLFRLKRQLAIISSPKESNSRRWIDMQELIAAARVRPICDLARDKLELKASGKNFVALCPFHNEKTPSCYFFTDSNTFHCFGCHEGGDVITFTMHLYGVRFTEAVKMLI
ncbi:MAG: CHC2 zinc finger domain-containing protein [Candidatus Moraniibacteriota bacterium]